MGLSKYNRSNNKKGAGNNYKQGTVTNKKEGKAELLIKTHYSVIENSRTIDRDYQDVLKQTKPESSDIDYHIELPIDAAESFDYEEIKNARFTLGDLR